MDYTVKDSSIYKQSNYYQGDATADYGVKIGMVREVVETSDNQLRYIVEVMSGNRTLPISCVPLTRFGGAFNYEEYSRRAWGTKYSSTRPLPPAANGNYKAKSGDVVLVAYLDGSSRQGVILGGLTHPSRTEFLDKDKIEYKSVFNGITKRIYDDGSYKVEFSGKPVNSALLEAPPTINIPSPIYNPLISGSFYGFTKDGSFLFSDGSNYSKLVKNKVSPMLSNKIGDATLEMKGTPGLSSIGMKSFKYLVDANSVGISGKLEANIKATQVSIKAQRIAIGTSQFELFQSLYEILDTLSKVFVVSPTGNTTPIGTNPEWIAKIEPLKIKLKLITGSLKDPDSFSPADPGEVTIEDS